MQGRRGWVLALVWLLGGLVMLAAVGWSSTRFETLLNGHPLTIAVVAALVVVGLLAVIVSAVVLVDRLRRHGAAERTRGPRRRWLLALSVLGLLICLVASGLVIYSRPFAADPTAVQAMGTTSTVRVSQRLTSYELVPTREDRTGALIPVTTGLVFYPGARVDARAYAAVLRPLASAGYLVVVLKEPFGLALLDPRQAESIPALHPEITRWAVGGHSLGGLPAATVAEDDTTFTGLLLWASEPAGAVDRSDLKVMSISGSQDGLETPDRIAGSRSRLPAASKFVVVDGGVHAFFGDYGPQPGDGVATVPRAKAQEMIAKASAELLAGLSPRPGVRAAPSSSPTR